MKIIPRIVARWKALYPNVNLSRRRIDALAAALAEDLEEEATDDDIDAAVKKVDKVTPFAATAKQDDELTQLRRKVKEAEPEKPDETKLEKTGDEKTDDVSAAIEKALQPFMAKLEALEAGKTTESRAQKLRDKMKEAGASDAAIERAVKNFNRMKFETDEDFDAHVTEEAEFAKTSVKADAERSAASIGAPTFSKKEANGVSSNTAAYIAAKKAEGKPVGKTIFES